MLLLSSVALTLWAAMGWGGGQGFSECSATREKLEWSPSLSQRRRWHPTPVLLPGKSHGRRSLVGCSPWGREESDMTERLHSHFSLSCIGEGNGNPLQCSCLQNPRDRGAWWAAVYGVAQSWTRLTRFSSSKIPMGLPWWLSGKDPACQRRRQGFNPWVGKNP